MCFNLEAMTEDIMRLYKIRNDSLANVINLAENQTSSNRNNFKSFFNQNYKKFFYK